MSAVPTTPVQAAADAVALPRALVRYLALPLVFAGATLYHFLQSRGHATPTIFNDELLYAKLAQSLAAGHGLTLRGEHFFFPSPLASLVQAPVWLLRSMTDAYAAAKLLNAAVMSAAVFPSYWLARRVVRPSFALLTAVAAVTTPAMVYHGYLMSEALAYPVFLTVVAILANAVAKPARWTPLIVPAACVLAIATRVQFIVLALAYVAAVAVCGNFRRHALTAASTSALVVVLVAVPGTLGQYGGAAHETYNPGAIAHWALTTGYLLPFSLGLAVVPGAVFGLALTWRQPIGAITIACTALFLGQAALISAGEAHRPLERYLFYVTPLLFIAFFAYVEHGAPLRLAYTLATCIGAVALSLVSLPGLTGTAAFFFDSVTLSGFARAGYLLGLANASLLYSLAPLALGAAALAVRRAPHAVALLAIGVSIATGAGVYATDRLVTAFSARTFDTSPPDWLDRSGLGPASYLVLPYGNYFLGTNLESWNRDLRHVLVLGTKPPDEYPSARVTIAADGTLDVDGRPAAAQTIVANVSGSAIALDGRAVAHPLDGLVAYRIPAGTHVRWFARGLAPDGWTGTKLRYQAWPARSGRYELRIAVPRGTAARKVDLDGRRFVVSPGTTWRLTVPTDGSPLKMNVDVPDAPLGGRVLGVKISGLRFLPRRPQHP
ncbi:MAG: hypothetical protein E6G36_01520 [Actinobacteria bacterium]|nr:MAG: hypothetical protein E6G36_01520 [Actinomycetota bacterium]